jgi:hypothetical protein
MIYGPVGVALTVAVGSVVGGVGAEYGWNQWVPLDVREAIDAFLIHPAPLVPAAPAL